MFTLSMDGVTVGTQAVSTSGPVSIPWTTSDDGTHTITATVREATGKTGSTSTTVMVAN